MILPPENSVLILHKSKAWAHPPGQPKLSISAIAWDASFLR